MAESTRTYRREAYEGGDGLSAVAIVAIVLVVLVGIVLMVMFWDDIFGTGVVDRTNTIVDRTIIDDTGPSVATTPEDTNIAVPQTEAETVTTDAGNERAASVPTNNPEGMTTETA